MEDVSKSGRTILFVSHDLNAISSLCSSVVVLREGALVYRGDTAGGLAFYQQGYKRSQVYTAPEKKHSKPVFFKSVRICTEDGSTASHFIYDQPIRIDFDIAIMDRSIKCDLFLMILDARKRRLFALESSHLKDHMSVVIEAGTFVRGSYSICAYINQPNIIRFDEIDDVCEFEVIDNGSQMLKHGAFDYGGVFGRGKWQ